MNERMRRCMHIYIQILCLYGNQDSRTALTHSNNDEKTTVPFVWTAPDTPAGDVHFQYVYHQP